MNRNEEMQAIETHVQANGVYRARMGECHYGDGGPSYREKMTNIAKSKKLIKDRKKKAEARIEMCAHCKDEFKPKYRTQIYCGRPCYHKAAGEPVTLDGIRYPSQSVAAAALGIPRSTLNIRLNKANKLQAAE